MKMHPYFKKMLENKIVLYIVLLFSVISILGYFMANNIKAIILYVLIGFLTYHYSKNMTIILGTPLVLTSIYMIGYAAKEGFDNAANKKKTTVTVPTDTAVPEHITESEPAAAADDAVPASTVPASAERMTTMYKKNNRIDYAATVEDAYDDLNKILGGDGIKRLTDDTQKLMGQQVQLAEAMKSMSPLLEQAKGMLQGFDLKNLDGLASMAKSLGGAAN